MIEWWSAGVDAGVCSQNCFPVSQKTEKRKEERERKHKNMNSDRKYDRNRPFLVPNNQNDSLTVTAGALRGAKEETWCA